MRTMNRLTAGQWEVNPEMILVCRYVGYAIEKDTINGRMNFGAILTGNTKENDLTKNTKTKQG
jgi:hypothetical protein